MAAAKAINLGVFKGVFYEALKAPIAAITQKQYDIYSRSKSVRDGVVGDGAAGGWNDSDTTGPCNDSGGCSWFNSWSCNSGRK